MGKKRAAQDAFSDEDVSMSEEEEEIVVPENDDNEVDDPENRMVKSYCCVGSNALDFARFGKLYKQHGQWNGQQLLDSTFVATSVKARFAESPEYGYGFWLSDHLGKEIFVMRGILGQYVITIPEDDLIIVRQGHQRLPKADRPFGEDFYVYVEEAYKMLESKS